MKTVTRRRGQLKGEYVVYETVKECIDAGYIPMPWNSKGLKVGDWVTYADGRCAPVIKCMSNTFIFTPLNLYDIRWTTTKSDFREYRLGSTDPHLDKVDPAKIKFAEDWLLRGESLEKAVTNNLWKFNRNRSTMPSGFSARHYGYMILSGSWFDELLKTNRLMRDKYMSIVGAFTEAGITEDYLAKKIKEGIDSADVRKHINALNKAIEVLEAEANRRKGKSILPAHFSEVQPTQIPEKAGSVLDRLQIPKGDTHEAERSPSSAPERNTSVQVESPSPREGGGNGSTKGFEAVSTDPSNRPGLSITEQVSSAEKV